jgi:hypothetical protein
MLRHQVPGPGTTANADGHPVARAAPRAMYAAPCSCEADQETATARERRLIELASMATSVPAA